MVFSETSSIHSNAFNFSGYLNTGIDPRTGIFTCSLSLPEMQANDQCGPAIPVSIAFNPLQIEDRGLGVGWTVRLSSFDPASSRLTLLTGEGYQAMETPTGLDIKDNKLLTFNVIKKDDEFHITHKSGLLEILSDPSGRKSTAVTKEVRSAEGRSVYFDYGFFNGNPSLQEIRDHSRRLLLIQRERYEIRVTQFPDSETPAEYVFVLGNRHDDLVVTRVTLPVEIPGVALDERPSWRFDYDPDSIACMMRKIHSPTGSQEFIHYSLPGEGHRLPPHAPITDIPYVTGHDVNPGGGQATVHKEYLYSSANFLGYPTLGTWVPGCDNLYLVNSGHEYFSQERVLDGDTPKVTTRTYNHFHLMTREKVEHAGHIKHTETQYHFDPEKTFEEQDPNCQLPKKIITSWYLASDEDNKRCEIIETDFDFYGNLLRQVTKEGVVEVNDYYSPEGEAGCPKDPLAFVRFIKQKTLTPPSSIHSIGHAAHVVVTGFSYVKLDSLIPFAPYHIVQTQERMYESYVDPKQLRKQKDLEYVNEQLNVTHYGRLATEIVTINGLSTRTNHNYVLDGAIISDNATLEGFDGSRQTWTDSRSALNGLQMMTRDRSGAAVTTRYDRLGRIITVMALSDDNTEEATRHYRYSLAVTDNDSPYVEVTDVNNIVSRTYYDGLNREYRIEIRDADGDGEFVVSYEARFNTLGQLVEEKNVDDWRDGTKAELITTYQYDRWNERCSTVRPDGITEHCDINPLTLTEKIWLQGTDNMPSGSTVTTRNLFDKPVSVERYCRDGTLYSKVLYEYDSLGRCQRETSPTGDVTCYEYDVFGRLVATRLPDDTLIQSAYATHSAEDLPVDMWVKGKGWPERRSAGQQVFDGLHRRTSRTVGGRLYRFDYEEDQLYPSSETTPVGDFIQYTYKLALTSRPLSRKSAVGELKNEETYTYHPKHGKLVSTLKHVNQHRHDIEYFPSGLLRRETWIYPDGEPSLTTHYSWSLKGLPLSYTDCHGTVEQNRYDQKTGQLRRLEYGAVVADFAYNTLGKLRQSDVQADGQTLVTTLLYDEFGRENERTLTINSEQLQTLSQKYTVNDKLSSRTLNAGTVTLRDEKYRYDPRGRLVCYQCTGIQRPLDPFGKEIISQQYDYDAWDNLLTLTTVFSGGENIATYEYGNPADPSQLTQISHSHADYPLPVTLVYDGNGNLVHDERNRVLQYNALGQLTQIAMSIKEVLGQYDYDPLDRLIQVRQAGKPPVRRVYRDNNLASEVESRREHQTGRSYVRQKGILLGQTEQDSPSILYATDQQSSVLRTAFNGESHEYAYSPYGWRQVSAGVLGFNGEPHEPVTGGYLLGNGYRVYSPELMRFHRPDSLSPFDGGGLNPYVYCLGDPINRADPTGHLSWQSIFGIIVGAIAIALTVASLGVGAFVTAPMLASSVALTAFATAPASLAGVMAGVSIIGSATGIAASALAESDPGASKILGYVSLAAGVVSLGGSVAGTVKSIREVGKTFMREGSTRLKVIGISNDAVFTAQAAITTGLSEGGVDIPEWIGISTTVMSLGLTLSSLGTNYVANMRYGVRQGKAYTGAAVQRQHLDSGAYEMRHGTSIPRTSQEAIGLTVHNVASRGSTPGWSFFDASDQIRVTRL